MQTVSTSEATLSAVIEKAKVSPVVVQENGKDGAFLFSAEKMANDKLLKIETFERSRDAMAAELAANLAKEGITVEEFLKDLLRD